MTSDASGWWGCGAFWATYWFQLQWPELLHNYHITIEELIPIVIAAPVWSQQWTSYHVIVRCDNAEVVHILNWDYSRGWDVVHLVRCLHFIMARFDLQLSAEPIQSSLNTAADALSWILVPTAEQFPPPNPQHPDQHPNGHQTWLALHGLDGSVYSYFEQLIALSIRHSYSTGQNHYLSFCSIYTIPYKWSLIM